MSDTEEAAQAAGAAEENRHDGPIAEDVENPWHGIPQELLDARRPYDPDSAGGCG
jgi:hypothetical protein